MPEFFLKPNFYHHFSVIGLGREGFFYHIVQYLAIITAFLFNSIQTILKMVLLANKGWGIKEKGMEKKEM